MKKTAVLFAVLMLTLFAVSAQALTMTGLESETVTREWKSSLFFERMEEMTGVAVEPHEVTDVKEYQKLLSGMLEGSIPADVLFKAELTRTQERALLDAGALIDLAPLMQENMPNLSALLAEHPEWKDVITLEDGRIASLPLINDAERQVCVWINKVWLEALKLDMPASVDELTAVLTAMRDKDPNGNYEDDEIAADLMGVWEMRWLLPYFGIAADDYNITRVDGEAVFAPELPAYREFVALLKSWYEAGILQDSAFMNVHSAALYGDSEEETVAASAMFVSLTPYTHVPVDAMTQYTALLMPGPDGKTVWRDMLGDVWTGAFAVTSTCGDPAAALRWVDALYSEEGAKLAYAGVEGVDYSYNEDGYWVFEVDSFRTVDSIRSEVLMYTGSTMPGIVPNDFLAGVNSEPDRHVIAENLRVREVTQQVTPSYALSAEDQARANEIALQLNALVDTGIARFATGEEALDDEHWEAWLAQLRDAGSQEMIALFNL